MPDTQPALHTWHLLLLATFLSPRATLSVLSPLLHHQKRAEVTWKMLGTWEHSAAMVLRVELQRGEAEVKHSGFQMTYLFWGWGGGGTFFFFLLELGFYLRLLLTLGTPATDTVKHHSLLLGRRPSSWAVRGQTRTGRDPGHWTLGDKPAHVAHGPSHFSGRRITPPLGPHSLIWKRGKEFFWVCHLWGDSGDPGGGGCH